MVQMKYSDQFLYTVCNTWGTHCVWWCVETSVVHQGQCLQNSPLLCPPDFFHQETHGCNWNMFRMTGIYQIKHACDVYHNTVVALGGSETEFVLKNCHCNRRLKLSFKGCQFSRRSGYLFLLIYLHIKSNILGSIYIHSFVFVSKSIKCGRVYWA